MTDKSTSLFSGCPEDLAICSFICFCSSFSSFSTFISNAEWARINSNRCPPNEELEWLDIHGISPAAKLTHTQRDTLVCVVKVTDRTPTHNAIERLRTQSIIMIISYFCTHSIISQEEGKPRSTQSITRMEVTLGIFVRLSKAKSHTLWLSFTAPKVKEWLL